MYPLPTIRTTTACLVVVLLAGPRFAVQAQTAAAADVATIDALVRASYDVMNGPAGQPRQWRRDSTLYMPAATFVAVREVEGRVRVTVMSPEDYRQASYPRFERDGGYETEIGRHIERFGDVGQVRSVAVSRRTLNGPIEARYVNYYQVYWDGHRWWISGMVWDEETSARPIPTAWIGQFTEGAR